MLAHTLRLAIHASLVCATLLIVVETSGTIVELLCRQTKNILAKNQPGKTFTWMILMDSARLSVISTPTTWLCFVLGNRSVCMDQFLLYSYSFCLRVFLLYYGYTLWLAEDFLLWQDTSIPSLNADLHFHYFVVHQQRKSKLHNLLESRCLYELLFFSEPIEYKFWKRWKTIMPHLSSDGSPRCFRRKSCGTESRTDSKMFLFDRWLEPRWFGFIL